MVTPCNHAFHSQCLLVWMNVKMECPLCKSRLPSLFWLNNKLITWSNIEFFNLFFGPPRIGFRSIMTFFLFDFDPGFWVFVLQVLIKRVLAAISFVAVHRRTFILPIDLELLPSLPSIGIAVNDHLQLLSLILLIKPWIFQIRHWVPNFLLKAVFLNISGKRSSGTSQRYRFGLSLILEVKLVNSKESTYLNFWCYRSIGNLYRKSLEWATHSWKYPLKLLLWLFRIGLASRKV